MNEEISVEAANEAIDSLVNDIHKLQEPKTPTQKQIYQIISKMPSGYVDFYLWGMSREITEFIITEWEKIRNSPN